MDTEMLTSPRTLAAIERVGAVAAKAIVERAIAVALAGDFGTARDLAHLAVAISDGADFAEELEGSFAMLASVRGMEF